MKKGLLLCSGGMSTTMIAKALNEQTDMEWNAMGMLTGTEWQDNLSNYSIILVSPQIKFQFDNIKAKAEEHDIKVMQIEPQDYIVIKVPNLVKKIEKELS